MMARTRALLLSWLVCSAAAFGATPDAITPDGGRYYGPLVNGKLHGKGRIEWDNGSTYEGGFVNGLMSGEGKAKHAAGHAYEGAYRDGLASGSGRLEMSNGDVYHGEFRKNEPVKAALTRKDGSRYEGGFKNWLWSGRGRYTDAGGNFWEGVFVDGVLQGKGKAKSQLGTYEGEFKDWMYSGQGELRLSNGDVYRGGFAQGVYEGNGTLTYAKPKPDGRKRDSGVWHFGMLAGASSDLDKMQSSVEAALYAQKPLLDGALASLKPREAGKINLYLLAVGGDGSQEVFRREVEFVRGEFSRRFGTEGRTVALVNSRSTAATIPMATVTSIRDSLNAIAKRMDREQDILFLFLTSHGSPEHELSLAQNGMVLRGLRAAELARLLKESGIRWKVVFVSACYGGGFIDPLKDERTVVIAAARHDRRSFGCADENDFTYFGRAFFKESLPRAASFQDAFRKAEVLVDEWERKDFAEQAKAGPTGPASPGKEHSLPQLYAGKAIEGHLKRWWAQSSR